jgi:hypothetical protein
MPSLCPVGLDGRTEGPVSGRTFDSPGFEDHSSKKRARHEGIHPLEFWNDVEPWIDSMPRGEARCGAAGSRRFFVDQDVLRFSSHSEVMGERHEKGVLSQDSWPTDIEALINMSWALINMS